MAKSDSTSSNDSMRRLREQRAQAQQTGDAARVADLDRQIRDAETQSQSGTAQQ